MDLATLTPQATDVCYARIRELIMDADLLPNSHQDETSLAARTGLAESSIREATEQLTHNGLVTIDPRGGFRVSPLSSAGIVDTFQQIGMLEARAAYVVALNSASSIGMAALDDSILRMEDALFRNSRDHWARANHHFHRSLVQCSGHTGLISAALSLSDQVRRARMLTLKLHRVPAEATQSHTSLVEAIRSGLAVEARDIHLEYWRAAACRIVDLIRRNDFDAPYR